MNRGSSMQGSVLVYKMNSLTLWPWPLTFELQNSITSRVFQGHSLYQVWTLWDHSFLSCAADKQTDRQTNRLTRTSIPTPTDIVIQMQDAVVADVAACGCNPLGSIRDDCEQMTGRCTCRPGVTGQKCTICTNGNQLLAPGSCEGVQTPYFTFISSHLISNHNTHRTMFMNRTARWGTPLTAALWLKYSKIK